MHVVFTQRVVPLLVAASLGLATPHLSAQSSFQEIVQQGLEVTDARIQPLSFSEDSVSGILHTTVTPDDGTFWTLELVRHSMRADDFAVLVDDGVSLTRVEDPPITTWKGTVLETGDAVRASFDGTSFRGVIFTADNSWTIQPVSDAGVIGQPNLHAVYDGTSVSTGDHTCGVADNEIQPAPEGGGAQPFGTGVQICEIGLDADFPFYADNGQSVSATVASMESVMNVTENVYESNADITYEITTIVIRTVGGTYTTSSPGGLLSQFRDTWNSAPLTGIRGDVSHLFTGRNLSGTVIGIASLSVICNGSNHYGLSESSFTSNFNARVGLTAHELGHNWSAQHCNGASSCRIMCSGLGGCNGLQPLGFGPGPLNQIINHRNSRGCLSEQPPSLTLPFVEEFTTAALDTDVWTFVKQAGTSQAGVGEPSGTRSLLLNASGSDDYRDDEVRSNFIQLAGIFEPTLTYFTEHRGVESGEELVVEYWASNRTWQELSRVTSNGNDQSSFVMHTHLLAGNALHNEFRLRFRTEVNNVSDNWFIDSITITEGIFIPDPPSLTSVTPAISNIEGGISISVLGDDLLPDAVVSVGGVPLVSQEFMNGTQITGIIAPSVTSGLADVTVAQSSGTATLTDGFRFINDKLIVESKTVTVGSNGVNVGVTIDNETEIAGYSYGVDFDPDALEIADVNLLGTMAEGSWFVSVTTNNDNTPDGGWLTIGVIFDQMIQTVIPSGTNQSITNLVFDVSPTAPTDEPLELQIRDDLNTPAVDLVFALTISSGGTGLRPARVSGFLTVEDGTSFLRGDANGSNTVDIADAVLNLGYQFDGSSVGCLDALDVNDDGQVNIGDPISLLGYLFNMEAPPAAPFPAAGVDPTPDAIECVPAP